jgi:hypothetical protein
MEKLKNLVNPVNPVEFLVAAWLRYAIRTLFDQILCSPTVRSFCTLGNVF